MMFYRWSQVRSRGLIPGTVAISILVLVGLAAPVGAAGQGLNKTPPPIPASGQNPGGNSPAKIAPTSTAGLGLSGEVDTNTASAGPGATSYAFDLATGQQKSAHTIPGNGRGIALDPDGTHVWLTWVSGFSGDGLIHEYDRSTFIEVRTVPDPGGVGGPGIGALDFDPGTGHLWVASYRQGNVFHELDVATGTVVKSCTVPISGTPFGGAGNETLAIAHPADLPGQSVLLTDFGELETTLYAVDLQTCAIIKSYTTPVGLTGIGEDPISGHLVASDLYNLYDLGIAPYATILSSMAGNGLTEDIALSSGAGVPGPPLANGDRKIVGSAQEPSLTVDPKNPKHVVVGYNSSGGFGGLFVHCGFAASWDGGKTWPNKGTLGSIRTQGGFGDPSVVFAPDGTVFYACMTQRTHHIGRFQENGIGVYKSTDGGKSFTGVSLATTGVSAGNAGTLDDQETLAIGSDGHLHICASAHSTSSNAQLEVVDSDNSGRTWSAPQVLPNSNGDTMVGCGIAVTGSGRIWVTWWNKTQQVALAAYRDPGQRKFISIGSIGSKNADSGKGLQVRIAADPTPGSKAVAAVWPTQIGGHSAAVIAYTTDTAWFGDCGATDSSLCVLSPPFADQSEPALSWGADGKVLVGYYQEGANGLTYRIGRAAGLNQPFGFTTAASSPSGTSKAVVTPFDRLGDYTSVAEASDGHPYAAWSDTRDGAQAVWGAS